jgi:hypothetical protein
MRSLMAEIVVAFVVVLWLLACVLVYRLNRPAAWLAGSTVAPCLFFLGTAVATGALVRGTAVLLPLGVGVVALCLLHLRAAQWRPRGRTPGLGGPPQDSDSAPPGEAPSEFYI